MAEPSEHAEPETIIGHPDGAPATPTVINGQVAEPAKGSVKGKTKPEPTPKSGGGFWIALILLMVFGLAGAGFYLFSQLRDKQEGLGGEVKTELAKQIKDYQSQLTAIQGQISTLQSEISGKENRFNKILSDFSSLQTQKSEATRKELTDKVTQIQRQLGKTRGDWLVADAEYLLSVANERLHLVGDVNTSRAALEAADQRLRESGDSGIIPVREQIAKELSQLQGVKMPDVVGLYGSIQALESDVGKLVLALPYSGKPLTPPEEHSNDSALDGESSSIVNNAIQSLEDIVTIKRTEKPVKEILTQEQAEFLREQLKVKLEIAKIALVQQNDSLYQSTLADVKKWMAEHFTDNDNAKLFVGEIDRLLDVKLRKQFPDISLSLKMLRDVSKLRIEADKALGDSDQGQKETDEAKSTSVTNSKKEDGKTEGKDEQAKDKDKPSESSPGQPK